MLSLNFEQGENRFRLEPVTDVTPESLYERRWALTMLDRVMARLQGLRRSGSGGSDRLQVFLTGEARPRAIARRPPRDGRPKARQGRHRLRRRFREAVLAEIAQTVAAPEEVDEELRHLFEAIRSRPS